MADALAAACADPELLPTLVGPTGTGKTALACSLAERLDGEIVSVDSVQIYRGVELGTGKPSREELERAPHHLVSAVDLDAPMDAGRFAALANAAIVDIRARGKRPILCGGTFLWVKALVDGLAELPPANPELRAEHLAIAEREGRPGLHARLAAVDPTSAAKLAPNDFVRVSRALEVLALTGRALSEHHAEHGFRSPRHRALLAAIAVAEPAYTEGLSRRVDAWLAAGWLEEVRSLRAQGFAASRPLRSVGFAEVARHLDGELPTAELAPTIVRATRVFARRQRTWLKAAGVAWLAPDRAIP